MSEQLFASLGQKASPELVAKVKCVFGFKITNNGETTSWIVDLKNGAGSVKKGEGKTDCTITVSEENFIALMSGKLNPMNAFFSKKIAIKGNVMMAQKLSALIQPKSKM